MRQHVTLPNQINAIEVHEMDERIVSEKTHRQNRTPNCECILCAKPLYRRPFELKKSSLCSVFRLSC